MNGKSPNPQQLQAIMQQMAKENQIRQQAICLFLGLSGVATQLLGLKMVKCTCMQAGCSGHAIQFDNKAHFTQHGIVMIPRGDATSADTAPIAPEAGGPATTEPAPPPEDATPPSIILKP
jgi:hypothetical protein